MRKAFAAIVLLLSNLLGMAIWLIPAISYIYFLYRAAKLDHWVWFAVGFIVPPIGIIGGIIAWAGFAWAPDTIDTTMTKQEALQARRYLSMSLSVIERCSWSEFNGDDKLALNLFRAEAAATAKEKYGALQQEIDMEDGMGAGGAATVNCSDPKAKEGLRKMIAPLKAHLGIAATEPG